jgi:LemA protein
MRARGSVAGVALAFIAVLALFALVVGGCAYQGYNQAVRLDEHVKGAWAQVENILQSRFDLIPNLVQTVKGYAQHEKKVFTDIAEARTKYFQSQESGSRDAQVAAAGGFERALSRLLVLQEQYPELKAQASFQDLQVALEGTERRLAVERKRYNDSVRELNTFCRKLLGRMYAGWAGVAPAAYFEIKDEARQAPQVDLDG